MIATTIINSIRVKPFCVCMVLNSICALEIAFWLPHLMQTPCQLSLDHITPAPEASSDVPLTDEGCGGSAFIWLCARQAHHRLAQERLCRKRVWHSPGRAKPLFSSALSLYGRFRSRPWSRSVHLQPEGHRTVVAQAHLHVGAKDAAGHGTVVFAPGGGEEVLVQRLGQMRCARAGEAGAQTLAGIGRQRELGHHQQFAPNVAEAAIHTPVIVGKNEIGRASCRARGG